MKIDFGIQPNCSECAFVIYPSKLDKYQKAIFKKYCVENDLTVSDTKLGNKVILTDGKYPSNKEDLWEMAKGLEDISSWEKHKIEREKHFDLIRDESWDDLYEEGKI